MKHLKLLRITKKYCLNQFNRSLNKRKKKMRLLKLLRTNNSLLSKQRIMIWRLLKLSN
jgi:hypothetical protein